MDQDARRHKKEREEARINRPAKMSKGITLVFILVPLGLLAVAVIVTFILLKASGTL